MLATTGSAARPQRPGGGRFARGPRLPGNPSYDGAFTFCRIMFRNSPYGEIRKALPSGEFPIVDLPLDHPIFHTLYEVRHLPQIPSIDFYFGSGGRTSERGAESAQPHARAIVDAHGHMIVLFTHNTDFGDAFER